MKKIGLGVLLLVGLLLVSACAAPKEAAPPPVAPKASPASIAKGGLIYDAWWKVVEGAAKPTDNSSLWATQTTNKRSGGDTWRCKECHGWDYKGKDGAYGKGSHLTGFPGVYNASLNKTQAELLDVLKGKANSSHDFASLLGETGLNDVVNFLKEGVVDETQYIDSSTKKAIGANTAHGQELYAGTCAACHGADGKMLNFGSAEKPEYLGTLANDNPWETLHKIRFGQPGAPMPSGVVNGWSTQDAVDVLGYAQSLPEK